ncbi:MAG: SHOCT domain-containing protein [Omnitrophica WOR_2 bacterium]
MMYGYGCNWLGSFGPAGMIISLVFGLLLIVGLALLAIWAIRRFTTASPQAVTPGGQPVRDILQARYARGEITREQYQQMLEDQKR